MSISRVIRNKGDNVATVTPETLVVDAARKMNGKRIGVLVVCTPGGRMLGILSELDVVKAVADQAGAIASLSVDHLYTRDPHTCTLQDDPRTVMRDMHEGRFRHMPVVSHGALQGLVSVGDIMEFLKEEADVHGDASAWAELDFL